MSPGRRAAGVLRRLYSRAFDDNLTGLAGMVAYNLLLSIFPLALIALFIASHVLQSPTLQSSIFEDLRQLFPSTADSTLVNLLDRIKTSTTGLGILAVVVSIWIGSSFWGALDTAFCRIYHVECRSWLRQKGFALLMLAVSLLFIAATVALPTLQSIVVGGADDLPLGLADVQGIVFLVTLVGSIALLFVVLSIIYRTVPNEPVPWRAVWPGAAAATVAMAVVDYAFPAYLSNISALAGLGTTLIFIVIVLIWFYVLAIIILAGGEINAMRLETMASEATGEAADHDGGHERGESDEPPPGERAKADDSPRGDGAVGPAPSRERVEEAAVDRRAGGSGRA